MAEPIRLCFVCMGNIVRSPLAEHLFAQVARHAGVDHKYTVRSAGTGPWHVGETPDARMRSIAASRGLVYTGRACQFQRSDFDECDLILAMDSENQAHLRRMARSDADRQKIRLLREFDPMGGRSAAVPDPYYGGIDGFEEVYEVVERSVQGLLESLERGEAAR
jgi:protein-tyrosine phosphatase